MPKGTPVKKVGPEKLPAKQALEGKEWDFLPGELPQKRQPFTLPEQTIADHEEEFEKKHPAKEFVAEVPGTWTEETFSAQVDRDELERLLGGKFEDVANEPGRRSNQKFETYSDGVDCYCYQCPRGSKPPVVARTWAEVAQRMGV